MNKVKVTKTRREMGWKVKDTPCRPNRWKIYPPHPYRETNAPVYYFPTIELANEALDKPCPIGS